MDSNNIFTKISWVRLKRIKCTQALPSEGCSYYLLAVVYSVAQIQAPKPVDPRLLDSRKKQSTGSNEEQKITYNYII